MTVQFGVLGPLLVHDGQRSRPIAAPKLRIILATLLLRAPHVVTVDELTDLVWEADQPRKARAALHTYIGRLRQSLGPLGDRIRTVPPGYVIDVTTAEFDLGRFVALQERGIAAAARGEATTAATDLRSALALQRGDPLADTPSNRLRRDEGHRLTELHTQTWEACIDAEMAAGRYSQILGDLQHLVAAHPLRERFHEQLMVSLYLAGRRADALTAFQAARQVLIDELGIEPGPALRRVQQMILADNPALAASSATPAGAVNATVAPGQLPSDIGDFTGRSTHVRALRDALGGHGDRVPMPGAAAIAVITGTGGVGKTTLAVHVAHRLRPHFPDGQIYVHMRGTSDDPVPADDVAARLLRELGVDPAKVPTDASERQSLYRTVLAERRLLIVLDDARDTAHVRALIPGSARCGVLITSRAGLATLPVRHRVDLDMFDDDAAARLFTRIVGADRAAAEPDAVVDVLRACAGLPLAIRIAAARLVARPTRTIRALADRLTDARARLDQLEADDLGVRAAFMISYLRLPDATHAATAFRLLGLWPGADIGVPAIGALLGQPLAITDTALDTLVDAHLVQSPAPDRYRLHDLLHAYARERADLEDPPVDRDAAVARLITWYLHTAVSADTHLRPHRVPVPLDPAGHGVRALAFDDYAAALAWCQEEQANLISAVRVAAAAGLHGHSWRLALTLWSFYYIAKRRDDWLATTEIGLACARLDGDDRAEGSMLASLGTVLCESRRYDEAITRYEQALTLHRASGDRDRESQTLNSLAVVYAETGRFALALTTFAEVRDAHERLGHRQRVGLATTNMAMCYMELDQLDAAVSHNRDALSVYREVGDRYFEAITLANLGEAYVRSGAPDLATTTFTEAIRVHEEVGNRHGVARTLLMLGNLQAGSGDRTAARGSWSGALANFEGLDDPEADEVRALLAGSDVPATGR